MEKTLNKKPDTDVKEDTKTQVRLHRHKRIRKAYERSGLNYGQMCVLLGVKRDTLAHWLARAAIRVPPEYVVQMIEKTVDEYLKKPYKITIKENEDD